MKDKSGERWTPCKRHKSQFVLWYELS